METTKITKILSTTVISIDVDGFAVGKFENEDQIINHIDIPFNHNNIVFGLGDILLLEVQLRKNIWKLIKIIKKINIVRKQFFAEVKLKSKNLILQELDRSRYKENIKPIPSDKYSIKNGDIVRAQIASGKTLNKLKIKKIKKNKLGNKNGNLLAEILEIIGSSFDPKTFSHLSIKENDIKTDFNQNIKEEIKSLNTYDYDVRTDLSSVPFVTIDGEDAKDFDDALSIKEINDEVVEIGVHIADVSAYVKPQTPLDVEAQNRGNSTYLVGTVIPMLPHSLSNGLCSLVEAEDRLTKSVIVQFNKKIYLKNRKHIEINIQDYKLHLNKVLTIKNSIWKKINN